MPMAVFDWKLSACCSVCATIVSWCLMQRPVMNCVNMLTNMPPDVQLKMKRVVKLWLVRAPRIASANWKRNCGACRTMAITQKGTARRTVLPADVLGSIHKRKLIAQQQHLGVLFPRCQADHGSDRLR